MPDTPIEDAVELLPIQVYGYWGYANREGSVIVPPMYEWTDYFYLLRSTVYETGGSRGRSYPWYAWRARYIEEGNKTKWLTATTQVVQSGKVARSPTGSDVTKSGSSLPGIDRIMDGLYRGSIPNENGAQKYAYRSRSSNGFKTEPIYDGLLREGDGMIAFQQDDLCGFMRNGGKVVIPAEYAEVTAFSDGYAAVREPENEGGRWGYIDKRGEMVFFDRKGELEELRGFSDGMSAVRVKGKWGFLTQGFKPRVKPKYDEVRDFSNGLAAVFRDGTWSYIDKKGRVVAKGFEEAYDFGDTDRLDQGAQHDDKKAVAPALVKQDGLYGFIDRRGRWQIKPQYAAALPFYRGVARVSMGHETFGYIDQTGEIIWDPRPAMSEGMRNWKMGRVFNDGEPNPLFWRGVSADPEEPAEPYPFELHIERRLPLQKPFFTPKPSSKYNSGTADKV
ncbi:WG repeat-containing protein [Algisphaera agarilytica]|uniref:WG containing repeat-containing protein n=1 Tax=Algisphaera agarilytica TaxID=1385975 RepID=A0A7X0H487_9BACT|nr:WG repeat-containing protein [Algisphaera agarilytica]MBB6428960.1 hypothetical protein [Algisphaera agarilytica]